MIRRKNWGIGILLFGAALSLRTIAYALNPPADPPPLPDITPPTVPAGLLATAVTQNQITLSWTASTDPDDPTVTYIVYRNAVQVATPSTVRYIDSGLTPGTLYTYTVTSIDPQGNESSPSSALPVMTPGSLGKAPAITSSLISAGTVGVAYSYKITADQTVSSFTVTNLPADLSVDTVAGLISGSPGSADLGKHNIGLRATSATAGTGPVSTLVLTISSTTAAPPPAPSTPTLSLPDFLPVNAVITAGYSGSDPASYFSWTFTPQSPSSPAASGRGSMDPNVQGWIPRQSPRGMTTLSSAGAPAAAFSTTSPTANLAAQVLGLGPYQVKVTVTDSVGKESTPAQATVTLVAADLSGVKVYPNPWRSDKHRGSPKITFDNLTVNTTVKIFTVSGHHVKTLPISNSRIAWDLTNDSGDKVASGVYVFLITADDGQRSRGKLAIVR